jgi:hypothetical protein
MKKLFLFVSAAILLVACSKVGKGEYIISGTAKGIENGKTIILETQDETGMLVAKDTAKVENGKFEMKGKISETAFYTIKLEGAPAPVAFILEEGEEVTIEINKDSIQKSKVSGTYNNDEYVKFTDDLSKIQKKLIDFHHNTNIEDLPNYRYFQVKKLIDFLYNSKIQCLLYFHIVHKTQRKLARHN